MSIFSNIFTGLKDILSPKKCIGCHKEGNFLCKKCFEKQDRKFTYCYICKKESPYFDIHKKCHIENRLFGGANFNNKQIFLSKVLVLTQYRNSSIKTLITQFKFYGKKDIGGDLAVYLATLLKNNIILQKKEEIIITGVPLHFLRKIMRGFNQSQILATKTGQLCNIKYINNVVLRKRYTRQQSKLGQEERVTNLDNAFKINKKHLDNIDKKTIIVVDDVISSGTTLNEIAKILKQNGAKKVIGLCLASN